MKPIWVIENYCKEQEDLAKEVTKQGYDLRLIKPVPLEEYISLDEIKLDGCVIFQGTIETAEKVQTTKPNWSPGVIANFDNYNYINHPPQIKEYFLNKDFEFYRPIELLNNKWDIYRKLGKEGEIWIRPNSSRKSFASGLVNIEEFDKFYEENISVRQPSELVIVSSPKEINAEFRFVVSVDGIVAKSCYMYQQNRMYVPSAPTGATELVSKLLKLDFHPDYFFVIDVCEDKEGKFSLLEYNAFSTSGLYACNKEIIVKRVSDYAEWLFDPITSPHPVQ